MAALVPIVTTTLGVNPELATKIMTGLSSGLYERVGGVIRNSDTKDVVLWLRSTPEALSDASLVNKFGPMLQLGAATSLLNLSISLVGFGVVINRLNGIEIKLAAIEKTVRSIERKMDITFYANVQAALELARKSVAMQDATNRQASTTQAINRFLEAEHHYLELVDIELQEENWATIPFLNTLFLIFISTARCYLELDEISTARNHLREAGRLLSSRVDNYYAATIGINPAVYLHPNLADDITLDRMTLLMQRRDPHATQSSVFESLREDIWNTASQSPVSWLKKLPESIWEHEKDSREKVGVFRRQRTDAEMMNQIVIRLPETFAQVEQAYEWLGSIEGYQTELQYLENHNISFAEWTKLELPTLNEGNPIAFLLPENSRLVES